MNQKPSQYSTTISGLTFLWLLTVVFQWFFFFVICFIVWEQKILSRSFPNYRTYEIHARITAVYVRLFPTKQNPYDLNIFFFFSVPVRIFSPFFFSRPFTSTCHSESFAYFFSPIIRCARITSVGQRRVRLTIQSSHKHSKTVQANCGRGLRRPSMQFEH